MKTKELKIRWLLSKVRPELFYLSVGKKDPPLIYINKGRGTIFVNYNNLENYLLEIEVDWGDGTIDTVIGETINNTKNIKMNNEIIASDSNS